MVLDGRTVSYGRRSEPHVRRDTRSMRGREWAPGIRDVWRARHTSPPPRCCRAHTSFLVATHLRRRLRRVQGGFAAPGELAAHPPGCSARRVVRRLLVAHEESRAGIAPTTSVSGVLRANHAGVVKSSCRRGPERRRSLGEDRAFTYVPPGGVVHRSFARCGDSLDFQAKRSIEVPDARAAIRAHGAVLDDSGWRRVGDEYERMFGGVTVRAGFELLGESNYRLLFGASLGFFSRCHSF
jgi:hypothetical protein